MVEIAEGAPLAPGMSVVTASDLDPTASFTVPDFNATIAAALGMPLEKQVHSPSMRPFTIADKGKPVLDLLT